MSKHRYFSPQVVKRHLLFVLSATPQSKRELDDKLRERNAFLPIGVLSNHLEKLRKEEAPIVERREAYNEKKKGTGTKKYHEFWLTEAGLEEQRKLIKDMGLDDIENTEAATQNRLPHRAGQIARKTSPVDHFFRVYRPAKA